MAKKKEEELFKKTQRSLIASLLYNSDKASDVFELVESEDFHEAILEIIYDSILNVSRKGEDISIISIAEDLQERGELENVGGVTELYSLRNEGQKALSHSNVRTYARIVREYSAKNRARELLDESREFFEEDSGKSVQDATSEIQSELNKILFKTSDSTTVDEISDLSKSYLELLEERKRISEENAEDAEGLQGIPSTLPTLNRLTTGWLPGQLITVGARTGIGKSVFAVNCAIGAMSANKSVMFFSLEMSKSEIMDRIVAFSTGIPMNDLKKGLIYEDDNGEKRDESLKNVAKEMTEMANKKLLIDVEAKDVTVDKLRAKAIRRAQSEEGLDLIIVDYIQLLKPVGQFSNRQEAVASLSRDLKLLAKQLDVPIIILSQLNRGGNEEEDNIPTINNIRESGAIGQDSDIIILLHRSEPKDEGIPPTLVILAKQRNGEANKTIRCHSNLSTSAFLEMKSRKAVDADDIDDSDFEDETIDFGDDDFDMGDDFDDDFEDGF